MRAGVPETLILLGGIIGVKRNAERYMFCVVRARELHGVGSGNPGSDSATLSRKLIFGTFRGKVRFRIFSEIS